MYDDYDEYDAGMPWEREMFGDAMEAERRACEEDASLEREAERREAEAELGDEPMPRSCLTCDGYGSLYDWDREEDFDCPDCAGTGLE